MKMLSKGGNIYFTMQLRSYENKLKNLKRFTLLKLECENKIYAESLRLKQTNLSRQERHECHKNISKYKKIILKLDKKIAPLKAQHAEMKALCDDIDEMNKKLLNNNTHGDDENEQISKDF